MAKNKYLINVPPKVWTIAAAWFHVLVGGILTEYIVHHTTSLKALAGAGVAAAGADVSEGTPCASPCISTLSPIFNKSVTAITAKIMKAMRIFIMVVSDYFFYCVLLRCTI